MKRKTKFDRRIDIRLTEEQETKLISNADSENITPPQLIRNLIDKLK